MSDLIEEKSTCFVSGLARLSWIRESIRSNKRLAQSIKTSALFWQSYYYKVENNILLNSPEKNPWNILKLQIPYAISSKYIITIYSKTYPNLCLLSDLVRFLLYKILTKNITVNSISFFWSDRLILTVPSRRSKATGDSGLLHSSFLRPSILKPYLQKLKLKTKKHLNQMN